MKFLPSIFEALVWIQKRKVREGRENRKKKKNEARRKGKEERHKEGKN